MFNRNLLRAWSARSEVRAVVPISFLDYWRAPRSVRQALSHPSPELQASFPIFYYTPKVFRGWFGEFLDWSVGRHLRKEIADFRPEGVLSYWAHPDGMVATRAAHRFGLPSVIMVGGTDVLLRSQDFGRKKVIVETLKSADGIITVSEHLRTKIIEFGIEPEKIHVVRRGVDKSLFHSGDQSAARTRLGLPLEGLRALSVGRLVPVKGFDVLIKAWKLLLQQSGPIHLDIVGGGELREKLHALIEELGLSGSVTLVGEQSQERLVDWYRASDLTILSSYSEGVPNVLLESAACGTPFVATAVGGVPEICAEDLAPEDLAPPGDPSALAECILKGLSQQDPLNANQTKRPPSYQPESWEQSVERCIEVFRGILDARATNNSLGKTPVLNFP